MTCVDIRDSKCNLFGHASYLCESPAGSELFLNLTRLFKPSDFIDEIRPQSFRRSLLVLTVDD